MEYVIDFFATNYILIIILCVIIIMFFLGYYAEKTNFGEIKYKDRNKNKNEEEEVVEEEPIPILEEETVDLQTAPVENNNIELPKEEVKISTDIETDDLEVAFQKAFQEQISLADSEYLDEDIDNMKVDPLFSDSNDTTSIIDSNIKLPEIKKMELKDEIIWDAK